MRLIPWTLRSGSEQDYLSLVLTPLQIRWTISLSVAFTAFQRQEKKSASAGIMK
jgi:hypothetical protein